MSGRPSVGIDLGTTHTAVAFDDGQKATVVPIMQKVSRAEQRDCDLLPSALYAPIAAEDLDCDEATWVVGAYAKSRAAETEGRAVLSAKSWLCHSGVDREASILPWGGANDAPTISPLDASAMLLRHIRRHWPKALPKLADCTVTIAVPASFDEAAKELTKEAAKRAGFDVTLVEEPQAAYYSYLQHAGESAVRKLAEANGGTARVLVCDVGGGTTDLALLRTTSKGAKLDIERIATGPHLLVGGDNMDLALAYAVEERFEEPCSPRAFAKLVMACRAAKESLLTDGGPEEVPVVLAQEGASLVGRVLRTSLTRTDVHERLVEGFFPKVEFSAPPVRSRAALTSFGLPYERDSAITRHVAAFLRDFGEGALPQAVLFNGGVFHSKVIEARVLDLLSEWAGKKVVTLSQPDPDMAVARGAARFGRSIGGTGLRIRQSAARSYYVGAGEDGRGVCVLPRGVPEEEWQEVPVPIEVVRGRIARFDLFVSGDARIDSLGAIVDMGDKVRLPPLVAELPGEGTECVTLRSTLSRDGLVAVELSGVSRTRLSFRTSATTRRLSTKPPASLPPREVELGRATDLIRQVLGRKEASHRDVVDLPRELEKCLGERARWSITEIRHLFDVLLELRGARRRSADHERVFWSLIGYAGRPGFGHGGDAERMAALGPLFVDKLAFPDKVQGWQAFLIAWRRVSPGLPEELQTAIFGQMAPHVLPSRAKKKSKAEPLAREELLEFLTNLERVPEKDRIELGQWLVEKGWTDATDALFRRIGRVGARAPTYASAHFAVKGAVAEEWVLLLLRTGWRACATAPGAFVEMARITEDRARDVSPNCRTAIIARLREANVAPEVLRPLEERVEVSEAYSAAKYEDALPPGLRLTTP